jgi:hypothetical protein
MNTDKRRLKQIVLSAFIGVHRRLKMPFPEPASRLRQKHEGREIPLAPFVVEA